MSLEALADTVDRIGKDVLAAVTRVADGLEKRNELLEESNAMQRTRAEFERTATEATKRIEDQIGSIDRLQGLLHHAERALRECNRSDLGSVRTALNIIEEYKVQPR